MDVSITFNNDSSCHYPPNHSDAMYIKQAFNILEGIDNRSFVDTWYWTNLTK